MELYRITHEWTEGTGQNTFSDDGATWQRYDGVNPWPGWDGEEVDRDDVG